MKIFIDLRFLLISIVFLTLLTSSLCAGEGENIKDGILIDESSEKPEASLPDNKKEESADENQNVKLPTNISSVEIQGQKTTDPEKILTLLSTKTGDEIASDKIQKDLQTIFDTGYFTDVKYDPELTEDGVKVVFRVIENPEVKSIVLKGNEMISSEELKSLMKTKEGEIFNNKNFEEDLKTINSYYDQEFGMAGLASHIIDIENPREGTFILTISEGQKVSSINFSGNTGVSSEELSKVILTKTGEYLNVLTINRDLEAISGLYDKKYSLFLDEPLTVNCDKDGILTYIITEAVIDKIVISGNTHTKDYVILRELKIKEGELLNKNILSENIKKLYDLGYFQEINVLPKPSGTPGHMILDIEFKEDRTGLLSGGLGFSDGLIGSINISEKNLFGTGRTGQINLEKGTQIENYNISYIEPYIWNTRMSLKGSLYYGDYQNMKQSVYNVEDQSYALYRYKTTGGSLTLNHPIREHLSLYTGINICTIETTATPTEDYPVIASISNGSGDLRSLFLGGLYDTRDDFSNPHNGFYNAFSVETAGLLGGDFGFTKYSIDNRKYLPAGSHTIAFKVMGGTSSGSLPSSSKFYLGGSENLRGYEYGELSGDDAILLQAEYRFPILKSKIFQGAVFFEAGNTSTHTSEKSLFERLNTDQGIGVRLNIPAIGMGAIRVDYSIRNDSGEGRLSIGLGQSF